MNDADLDSILRRLPQAARSDLRRLLYGDEADRDRIAEQLLRRRMEGAAILADVLDMLSIDDEARRRVVRLLGEIEAAQ